MCSCNSFYLTEQIQTNDHWVMVSLDGCMFTIGPPVSTSYRDSKPWQWKKEVFFAAKVKTSRGLMGLAQQENSDNIHL